MNVSSMFNESSNENDDSKIIESPITTQIVSEITVEAASSVLDDSLLVNTDLIAALFSLHTNDVEDIHKFRTALSGFDVSQLAKLLSKNEDDAFYDEVIFKYNQFAAMEKSQVQEKVRRSQNSQAVANLRAVQNDIISTGHSVACVTDSGAVMFLSESVGEALKMQIEDPHIFTESRKTFNFFDLKNVEKRLEMVVKVGPSSTRAVMSNVVGWFLMGRSYDVKKVDYKKFSKKLQPGTLSPLQATPKDFVANKCARIVGKAFDSALIVLDESDVYRPSFYPDDQEQNPVCIYASSDPDDPSYVSRNPSFHSDLSEWSWYDLQSRITTQISSIDTHTLTPAKQMQEASAIRSAAAESIMLDTPDCKVDLSDGGVVFPQRLQDAYGFRAGLFLHSRSYSNENDLSEYPKRIHIVKYTLASTAKKHGFSCAVIDPVSFCMIAVPSFLRRALSRVIKDMGHELGGLIDAALIPSVSTILQMIAIHYRLSLEKEEFEAQAMEDIANMLADDRFGERVKKVLDLDLDPDIIDNIMWYVEMYLAEQKLGYTLLNGMYTKEGKSRLAQLNSKEKVKSAKDIFGDDLDDSESDSECSFLSYLSNSAERLQADRGVS